jgi:hypothetical protein
VARQWFSLGIPVSSTNKTDRHGISEILLKVVLNTIPLTTSLGNSTTPKTNYTTEVYRNLDMGLEAVLSPTGFEATVCCIRKV